MNVQDKIRDPQQRLAAPPRRSGFMRGRTLGLLAIVVAALLGAGYYVMNREAATTGAPVLATATRGDVEDLVTAIGSLTPLTSVDVGAQVSGQLKKLYVLIGDEVKKDQLLAEIDTAVAAAKVDADSAQLQNFQAQLLQKQSDVILTQAQADRQTRLMKDNATSQDAFDTAAAASRSAQALVKSVLAQINQAQSTLKADQATLGYGKIYAPMTGTIAAIPAKEGQTLNANQQAPLILTISDLSTMTVSTQVSEADVPKLRIGMDAYFTTLGDPNRRWTGKLRQILPTPTVVNNVVLFTALFDVANPNKTLMPQMTAQVFFVRGAAQDAVLVPVGALRFTGRGGNGGGQDNAGGAARAGRGQGNGGQGAGRRGGGQAAGGGDTTRPRNATVIVVKDDGTQETRNVTVGVTDRVSAQILTGLAEGEKVVAGNAAPTTARGNQQRQGGLGAQPGRGPAGGFR